MVEGNWGEGALGVEYQKYFKMSSAEIFTLHAKSLGLNTKSDIKHINTLFTDNIRDYNEYQTYQYTVHWQY